MMLVDEVADGVSNGEKMVTATAREQRGRVVGNVGL